MILHVSYYAISFEQLLQLLHQTFDERCGEINRMSPSRVEHKFVTGIRILHNNIK
jgi:hypothetical protein